VEVGPATPPTVSDVETFGDAALVVEAVLSLLAAAADLALLPLQASVVRAIKKRIERYIFPRSYQR